MIILFIAWPPLQVIFQSEEVLIVNKPAGVVCTCQGYSGAGLLNMASAYMRAYSTHQDDTSGPNARDRPLAAAEGEPTLSLQATAEGAASTPVATESMLESMSHAVTTTGTLRNESKGIPVIGDHSKVVAREVC